MSKRLFVADLTGKDCQEVSSFLGVPGWVRLGHLDGATDYILVTVVPQEKVALASRIIESPQGDFMMVVSADAELSLFTVSFLADQGRETGQEEVVNLIDPIRLAEAAKLALRKSGIIFPSDEINLTHGLDENDLILCQVGNRSN